MSYKILQSTAQDTQALKQVWETIQPNSCPSSYNFHLHTHCSDGKLAPEELISQAITIGLKGLAITDHHSVKGYEIAQTYLHKAHQKQPHQPLPHLWTGVEVTSNLFGTEVHILGYGFDSRHLAMNPYLLGHRPLDNDAREVITAIHSAGGLVVLAHPERYRKPAKVLIPLAVELGIDGVETYYAYGNPNPWTPSPRQTTTVQELGQQYNLYHTCGTDTHGSSLLCRL